MNEELKKDAPMELLMSALNAQIAQHALMGLGEKKLRKIIQQIIDKATQAERKRCAGIARKECNSKIEGECIAQAIERGDEV